LPPERYQMDEGDSGGIANTTSTAMLDWYLRRFQRYLPAYALSLCYLVGRVE
jgi:hypothetical protein